MQVSEAHHHSARIGGASRLLPQVGTLLYAWVLSHLVVLQRKLQRLELRAGEGLLRTTITIGLRELKSARRKNWTIFSRWRSVASPLTPEPNS